ncbi:MAG: metalloregulator ArsR/SmtB family transcription factor [Ornithinimicrobium sp.]
MSVTAQEHLDVAFAALSNPTRRAMVDRLALGQATVSELAQPFDMSLPAISRHIKVLERAGLLTQSHVAQFRPCFLRPEPLRNVSTWSEQYRPIWDARFDRMQDYLNHLPTTKDGTP